MRRVLSVGLRAYGGGGPPGAAGPFSVFEPELALEPPPDEPVGADGMLDTVLLATAAVLATGAGAAAALAWSGAGGTVGAA